MMTRKIILALVACIFFVPVFTYADDIPSGVPFQALQQQIDVLEGEINTLKDKVAECFTPEPSNNQTRLLFPFVSNQAGFDTGISIANTTADPFGTTQMSGSCTLNYFGSTTAGGSAPSPQTSGVVPAGGMLIFSLSGGGNLGVIATPGFQGYIIAVCNFPLAHGFYNVSDVAATKIAASGHALVLPSARATDVIESRGQ